MEDYDLVDEEDFEDDDYFEEKYQGSEMADYRTHVSFTHSKVTKCDYSGIQKFQWSSFPKENRWYIITKRR